ncbi:MAG: hypothetical protein F6J94_19920 [Moorea sp. SIO1F2]|nr:hypothetical protein [Moorena sp. SIO1F2]NET84100.1 hypothetical protein [Moorena sp. SIO1F2]
MKYIVDFRESGIGNRESGIGNRELGSGKNPVYLLFCLLSKARIFQ